MSSANLTMTLELCVAVQSCVYREYRSGLRTQPCGAPVLRIRGDDVLLPILMCCCPNKLAREGEKGKDKDEDIEKGNVFL